MRLFDDPGLLADERGQSVQVGAAILLGFVVIAITIYQVEVVSSQNAEVEFNHNQEVRQDLTELRNAISNAGSQGVSESVSVKLGTQYPPRTIFVNPPPVHGQILTQPAGNISFENAKLEAGSYDGNANRLLTENHSTSRIVYHPRYFELDDGGTTVLEHSLGFNVFQNNATNPMTSQGIVNGDQLTLTVLRGNYSEQGTGSVSLDPTTVTGPTDPVTISNNNSGPIQLNLPTLTPSVWNETLGTSPGVGTPNASVVGWNPATQTIQVNLTRDRYQLRMALVGVGQGVSNDPVYNVTKSETGSSNGGGGSYNLSWDTAQIDSETGISCSSSSCTYNIAQRPISMTVNTSPRVSGASVDYSIEYETAAGTASFDPGTGLTDSAGENTSNLNISGMNDGDRIYVHANSGGSGDRLPVDFVASPFFDVSITDTNSPISSGDELVVNATVVNNGSGSDTQVVELDFDNDGTIEDSQTVTLSSGATQNVTLTYNTTESSGSYTVVVRSDDHAEQTTVTIGNEPYFEVGNFQYPVSASPDKTLNVNATINNTGTASGTQTIEYVFDGSVLANQTITLAAGGSTQVELTPTLPRPLSAGSYPHEIRSKNSSDGDSITIEAVPPEINSMNNTDYSQCSAGTKRAEYDVAWSVGDDNGDLGSVTIELRDANNNVLNTSTTTVSGANDTGTDTVIYTQGGNPCNTVDDIRLIVVDQDGQSGERVQPA